MGEPPSQAEVGNDDHNEKKAKPPLVDKILEYGQLAFDPVLSEETRQSNRVQFEAFLNSTGMLALIPALNLLAQPGRVQPWLRAPLTSALAKLPLRPKGVQHTIEFILSVHPSNSGGSTPQNTGKGASITHEALNAISRLLSTPPAGMAAVEWFDGIAPQLFALLEGEGGPGIDKVASFVIGFGILGRKQYGAPGMPGWEAFVVPLLHNIDPTIGIASHKKSKTTLEDDIVNLSLSKVLVRAQDVSTSIQRLSTLITAHPHPSLTKRLLRPIVIPLWSLSSWPEGNDETEKLVRKPARILLQAFLQLSINIQAGTEAPSSNILFTILQDLTFTGRSDSAQLSWKYSLAKNGGIQIEQTQQGNSGITDFDFANLDSRVNSFVTLLDTMPDLNAEISTLFVDLCGRWLAQNSKTQKEPVITRLEVKDDIHDVKTRLIEAKVVQKMMAAIPGRLIENSRQVLELVNQVLSAFTAGNGDEDEVEVGLSLLNIVLTAPGFQETPEVRTLLESIKSSLKQIGGRRSLECSSTANNLLLFLQYRKTLDSSESPPMATPTARQLEDKKTYSLAMSYLTGTDSPPPVRVQGLELLSQLIGANSSIIDVPALLILFSSLLQDSDEYIYLRAIKSFIQLSLRHPKAVLKDLIDRYVDSNEDAELDQRLRFGEALLQVIQSRPLAFSGDAAKSVCEGLLFVASRRGYKPKTERGQEKKNKLKRKQHQEAEEAWDGEVPDLSEDVDEQTAQNHEIISQIVTGWESKRGMEDIRIRASALSILGSGIETNIEGITSDLLSTTIDLCIHILTLEPELEKGILRRSAILLIMSFVKALDTARSEGKKPGFGFVGQSLDDIQRILGYVETTDNDGLVRVHARDVIEGLQTWQMNALIPVERTDTELHQLAGLSVNPRVVEDENGKLRPRIEEVE